ncbi:hypothetical protein [Alteromonas gilva]|uniref:Uncharacterized protein n=1 Tax=Alteromonas gilva TaxID=2987522 RepID=A0ABT5KX80_9ALTE|nr:hypothetical protein [Alteromonas gilva]MDC8829379.1 hypothetical protein [Alteromonas gilva]
MFFKMLALIALSIVVTDYYLIHVAVKFCGTLTGTVNPKIPDPKFSLNIKLVQSIPIAIALLVYMTLALKEHRSVKPISLGFLGGCTLALFYGNLAMAWTLYIAGGASSTSILYTLIALPVAACFLGTFAALICLYFYNRREKAANRTG